MNAEQKAALISFNEEKLAGLKFSLKQSAFESVKEIITKEIASTEIVLASLMAECAGIVERNVDTWRDYYELVSDRPGMHGLEVYTAPPVSVMKAVKLPGAWSCDNGNDLLDKDRVVAALREAGIQIEGEE